jgi:HD domain
MKSTYQIPGKQTVWEHGISVKDHTFDLVNHLRHGTPLKYQWRLPDWILPLKDKILSRLAPDSDLYLYTVFHDCGKPKCSTGARHFPDHARVSAEVFNEHFPDLPSIGRLIRSDMDMHLLKSCDVDEFACRPEAITLLIVALAEVHSNAQLFGGMDSTSFKIKWKQISKRGNQILCKI